MYTYLTLPKVLYLPYLTLPTLPPLPYLPRYLRFSLSLSKASQRKARQNQL